MRTSRGHLPVKTAMKKEQVRERERYRRKTRFSPPFTRKKCFRRTPYREPSVRVSDRAYTLDSGPSGLGAGVWCVRSVYCTDGRLTLVYAADTSH